MTDETLKSLHSGITLAEIQRAMSNGGDVSFLIPLLTQALKKPPIAIAATLETPALLPDARSLLFDEENALSPLLDNWRRGEGNPGEWPSDIDVTLLPLPPSGKNVPSYFEQALREVRPEVLALDTSSGELAATLRYALSLPAAAGATVYAEIRQPEEGKLYGKRLFSPGDRDENVILASCLERCSLLPVGKPYPAGHTALVIPDTEVIDEENSGLQIQDAHLAVDTFLGSQPSLTGLAERAGRIGATLENLVSPYLSRKLISEAQYTASRLLDLAGYLHHRDRKIRMLAILDIKHYPGIVRYLELIREGTEADNYLYPDEDRAAPLLMLGRQSFTPPPGEASEKSGLSLLFGRVLKDWSDAKTRERLENATVDRYIALILARIRTHPFVLRGASVRGSLGFKEVIQSLAQLDPGVDRGKIEKAALITLPSRLRLKPGTKMTRESVVSETVKTVLYGIEFYRIVYRLNDAEGNAWLSPEEINRLLSRLSLEDKSGQKDKDEELLRALEAQKLLRRGAGGKLSLTGRSLERLLSDLERRKSAGEVSGDVYQREKDRLTGLLAAARAREQAIPAREVAGMVIDFMDVVDTGFEREWGRDIGFIRMFSFYRAKGQSGAKLPDWQTDWTILKERLDALENRGILKTYPDGERAVSGLGLAALLAYFQPRNQELSNLRQQLVRPRVVPSVRNEEIRPFTAVNTYREISFRHTLKEVVKQRKALANVRKNDFRVYLKPRHRLATDIVICLDTSGSMAEHRKMIYARLATAAVAAAARENGDRTAVVSFEDAGQTSIPLSDESNELVNEYLAALGASGATNIGDGVKCAVDLLTRDPNHNRKRIFLVTDGEPNAISEKALKSLKDKGVAPVDLTEEAALVETRRAAARGISVSVIFLATEPLKGYNFVKNMARAGRGSVIILTCRDEEPVLREYGTKIGDFQEYRNKILPISSQAEIHA